MRPLPLSSGACRSMIEQSREPERTYGVLNKSTLPPTYCDLTRQGERECCNDPYRRHASCFSRCNCQLRFFARAVVPRLRSRKLWKPSLATVPIRTGGYNADDATEPHNDARESKIGPAWNHVARSCRRCCDYRHSTSCYHSCGPVRSRVRTSDAMHEQSTSDTAGLPRV